MQQCYGGPMPGKMLGHVYGLPGLAFALMVFPAPVKSQFGDSGEERAGSAFMVALLWGLATLVLVQTHTWGCFA